MTKGRWLSFKASNEVNNMDTVKEKVISEAIELGIDEQVAREIVEDALEGRENKEVCKALSNCFKSMVE